MPHLPPQFFHILPQLLALLLGFVPQFPLLLEKLLANFLGGLVRVLNGELHLRANLGKVSLHFAQFDRRLSFDLVVAIKALLQKEVTGIFSLRQGEG